MNAVMFALRVVVGFAFLLAGGAKLVGVKPLVEQFQEFGLPKGLMYLVGALELAGAIGLFTEPFSLLASLGLAGLMIGAIGSHLKARHKFDKTAPSLVLFVLAVVLAAMLYHS